MQEVEGIEPECCTCIVPPVSPEGQRVLELRGMLTRLHELVDSGTILKMYGVTREELEMLAIVEAELAKNRGNNDYTIAKELNE